MEKIKQIPMLLVSYVVYFIPIALGIFQVENKTGLLPNFAVFCGSGFYLLLAFFFGQHARYYLWPLGWNPKAIGFSIRFLP